VVEARLQVEGLVGTYYVLAAGALQAQSVRRRPARASGAIGVRVLIGDELNEFWLNATDGVYSEINDSFQHRILRSVVRQLTAKHRVPLTDQPGPVRILKDAIEELQASQLHPESFVEAVAAQEPRALFYSLLAYDAKKNEVGRERIARWDSQ
jgi:hypothetical protein